MSTGTYLTLQYLGLNGKRRHDFTATTYHYTYLVSISIEEAVG